MLKLRSLTLFLVFSFSLSACSVFGFGSGSGDTAGNGELQGYNGEAVGEGNIPIAVAGSELADINFDYNSSLLSGESRAILEDNAQWLLDNPDQQVVIEGHCDERGNSEYNLALGLRRAHTVKDFLRNHGIPESQMSTQSYGEELPLNPDSNESAWATNRRVHFSIN